jgi:hypothetical protein
MLAGQSVVQQLNLCFFVAVRLGFLGFHSNIALSVELQDYHCSGGRSGSQSIYLSRWLGLNLMVFLYIKCGIAGLSL